jgi:hypothetical protein
MAKTRKQPRLDTPTLREVYGEIILKKGCVLYHTSYEPFSYRADKPMLFCTLHPSEWEGINEYVTRIELKKDVSLLFMIKGIKKTHIFSALDTLINKPGNNLAKTNDNNLSCYTKFLQMDKFNGWLTSIENKADIEVALINDSRLFSYSVSEDLRRNWRNSNNWNNTITVKNWGPLYPICTRSFPAEIHIHVRFRDMIDTYMRENNISKFPNDHAFQVLLSNATILYHDSPILYLQWSC